MNPSSQNAGDPWAGNGDALEASELEHLAGQDALPLPFLPPVPGIALPENVIGPDSRQEITDTGPIPWRLVCHLVVQNDRGLMFTGTGWLGGPSTVFTAAHVLLNANQAHRATKVWVIPGRRRNVGTTLQASGMVVHPQWVQGQPAAFDVAAIWLPSPIGKQLGTFGFQARADLSLNQLPIESAGYPDARSLGLPIGTPMRCSDRIRGVLPDLLATQLDTDSGQSGSPVFVNEARGPIVLGVHAYGNTAANHAVRLTPALVQQLASWWR